MGVFAPGLTNGRLEPAGASTPSVALALKTCTLTFDRTWSPYIQGTVTLPLQNAADAAATDPKSGKAVKFTLTQSGGQSLGLVAWLRSRSSDMVASETTLGFASIESLLQDFADPSGNQYSTAQTDVAVLNDVISRLRWDQTSAYPVTGLTTVDGSGTFSIAAADAGWNAGATLWDTISSVEEPGGLWIRGDELGVAILRMNANYVADTSVHSLSDVDRIISVVDTMDRDSSAWANAVILNYVNASTGAYVAGDNASTGTGPRKTAVQTRTSKKVASGAAAALLGRMNVRGRTLQVTAIADLSCRPNQTWTVSYLGYAWTTKVQAVTFRYPDGLMDMTLNIIES